MEGLAFLVEVGYDGLLEAVLWLVEGSRWDKVCHRVVTRDPGAVVEEGPSEGRRGKQAKDHQNPPDQALVGAEDGPYEAAGALEMRAWDWSWSETLELQETHCN